MKTAHEVIVDLLIRGNYFAPFEVKLQLQLQGHHVSESACTARMREVRLDRFGGHDLTKRRRPGTKYYEYSIPTNQQQEA